MNVIRVRATYAPTARFATWLYTLAHNRLVDHWRATGQATPVVDRRRRRGERRARSRCRRRAPTAGGAAATAKWRRSARGARLAAAAQRDAFLLQQESGLSLAEIAA